MEQQELAQGASAVENGAPAGVADSSTGAAPKSADSQAVPSSPDLSSLDLTALPQFRKYQSTIDRQLAESKQAHERQLRELQERLDETAVSKLDDFGKLEYRSKRKDDELTQTRAKLQAMEAESERMRYLQDVIEEHGVPISALKEAASPFEVNELVVKHIRTEAAKQIATFETRLRELEAQQRGESNTVDTGTGQPTGPIGELRARYMAAKKAKSTVQMAQVKREALQQGFELAQLSAP